MLALNRQVFFMKKTALRCLSLSFVGLVLISCSNGTKTTYPEHDFNDIFWSISSAEKVVRDRNRERYAPLSKEATIDIKSCRGEYEAGHLVVTPKEDINYYEASISSLKNADGLTIPKNNIHLLAASYCQVKTIYDTATGEEPGWFPDALLPVDALVRRKENKIKKGENQSFYVSVETPLMQKPGLYTGTFYLTLDGTVKEFPVSLNVYDLKINYESHSRSCFETGWQFECGELDSTETMYMKYNHALYDYRLSAHTTMLYHEPFTDRDINEFTDISYREMQNPRCTNIALPEIRVEVPLPGIDYSFDEVIMKKLLNRFFIKSIRENYNMFKKTIVFMGGIIDEPDDLGIEERAIYVCNRFKTVLNETADSLKDSYKENPLQPEIIEGIRNIPNVVTASWSETLDGVIDTYCPKANFYDTPEQRSHYDSQKEKWWYTCVKPRAPYPTYHTEDSLSSPRLLSWMQANYDVVGNLFWSTNLFARADSNGNFQAIDDYYNGDACHYPGVNGDGYLFYPGKPYGIDGPVGSIRLEAIRDGLEEYEIFYNLKEKLKSLEIDKEPTFDFLTSYLYEGTKVNATSIEMEDAREDLIQLAMANENGSDFCIVKNDVDKDHNRIDYTFYANNGTSIKINGETLSEGEAYKNGHLFNISVNLNNDTNIFNIEVIYNGKTNVIEHNVGPKNDVYDANDLNNTFEKYNASIATSITSYDEYQNVLKMEIGKTTEKKQSIKFVPSFLKDIGEKTANMTFNIINPTSEDIEFSVGYRSSANTFDSYFEENLILKPGYNTITINLAITKWKSIGSLKYIMLVFGNSTSKAEEAKTVYLNNFIISKKQGGK